jgi:hypothetical protein
MPQKKNERVCRTNHLDQIGTVTEHGTSLVKVRWDDLTGGWYSNHELTPLESALKVDASPSLVCS